MGPKWSPTILKWTLEFKPQLVVNKGPKVCTNNFPSTAHAHDFMLLTPNSEATICIYVFPVFGEPVHTAD